MKENCKGGGIYTRPKICNTRLVLKGMMVSAQTGHLDLIQSDLQKEREQTIAGSHAVRLEMRGTLLNLIPREHVVYLAKLVCMPTWRAWHFSVPSEMAVMQIRK